MKRLLVAGLVAAAGLSLFAAAAPAEADPISGLVCGVGEELIPAGEGFLCGPADQADPTLHLGEILKPVTAPVAGVLAPVADTLAPVVAPVTGAVAPLLTAPPSPETPVAEPAPEVAPAPVEVAPIAVTIPAQQIGAEVAEQVRDTVLTSLERPTPASYTLTDRTAAEPGPGWLMPGSLLFPAAPEWVKIVATILCYGVFVFGALAFLASLHQKRRETRDS